MRIGAFELEEPIPELKDPCVFATLRPWIDVSNVGSLTLNGLETQFEAKELARLAKPGNFFDFTRYRPISTMKRVFAEYQFPMLRFATPKGKEEMTSYFLAFLNLMLSGRSMLILSYDFSRRSG